jgi:homopolymeric O-antigen transport system permease protein
VQSREALQAEPNPRAMENSISNSDFELTIQPRRGWQPVDLRELWRYRELSGFLVWRDVKIRYKQTVLGALWAALQPLIGMLIFGVLLTRVAKMPSDGSPYMLFVYAGLVPWTFFVNAVTLSSNSLIGNEQLITKIYFPRVFVPLSAIGALMLDMVISLVFMGFLMIYYRWHLSVGALWLPAFALGGFLTAAGLGLFLSALNVRYRDVKYAVPFCVQMLFFLTPVLYPLSHVPSQFKLLLSLNPMSGIVEGFRYALLGSPVSWPLVTYSLIGSVLTFLIGLFLFQRMERTFADVI